MGVVAFLENGLTFDRIAESDGTVDKAVEDESVVAVVDAAAALV